ncbi:MAG: hypothetical protein EOO93_15120 [Pedobacter sp.]|nr:MAG: hypothetical protein EOO93_15120 [Pedobacter sp.]
MANYRLNLNQQPNGDYEVHKDDCRYYPSLNYDYLGTFSTCAPAVSEAKRKHPSKKINGCVHCSPSCHTS